MMDILKIELTKKGRPFFLNNEGFEDYFSNKIYLRKKDQKLIFKLKTDESKKWKSLTLHRFNKYQIWYGRHLDRKSLIVVEFHKNGRRIELTFFNCQWHYRGILLTSLIS